jgi:excisionase family DNA binding protein
MSNQGNVLTISEVATDLRCSKAHVYNLVSGKVRGVGPIPVIAIGRRKLVLRDTLEEWKLKSQRVAVNDILPSSPEVDAVDA